MHEATTEIMTTDDIARALRSQGRSEADVRRELEALRDGHSADFISIADAELPAVQTMNRQQRRAWAAQQRRAQR